MSWPKKTKENITLDGSGDTNGATRVGEVDLLYASQANADIGALATVEDMQAYLVEWPMSQ